MFRSTQKTLFTLVMILCMLLITTSTASAQVWTDQEDYTPGSTVTIYGENSDGIIYTPGEMVLVNVTGPNGYSAACEAQVAGDGLGSWSCQVVLPGDDQSLGIVYDIKLPICANALALFCHDLAAF